MIKIRKNQKTKKWSPNLKPVLCLRFNNRRLIRREATLSHAASSVCEFNNINQFNFLDQLPAWRNHHCGENQGSIGGHHRQGQGIAADSQGQLRCTDIRQSSHSRPCRKLFQGLRKANTHCNLHLLHTARNCGPSAWRMLYFYFFCRTGCRVGTLQVFSPSLSLSFSLSLSLSHSLRSHFGPSQYGSRRLVWPQFSMALLEIHLSRADSLRCDVCQKWSVAGVQLYKDICHFSECADISRQLTCTSDPHGRVQNAEHGWKEWFPLSSVVCLCFFQVIDVPLVMCLCGREATSTASQIIEKEARSSSRRGRTASGRECGHLGLLADKELVRWGIWIWVICGFRLRWEENEIAFKNIPTGNNVRTVEQQCSTKSRSRDILKKKSGKRPIRPVEIGDSWSSGRVNGQRLCTCNWTRTPDRILDAPVLLQYTKHGQPQQCGRRLCRSDTCRKQIFWGDRRFLKNFRRLHFAITLNLEFSNTCPVNRRSRYFWSLLT